MLGKKIKPERKKKEQKKTECFISFSYAKDPDSTIFSF